MDDEAFARMLQQQLLDEERMLMEQEQQWLQQLQQEQEPVQHQPNLGDRSWGQNDAYQQPQRDESFNPQSYGLILQQQGFNKPTEGMEGATRLSAPPSGYRIGSRAAPPRPSPPQQQQQQQQHHMNPPSLSAPPPANEFLESDEELARRMQELETMGFGGEEAFGAALQPSSSLVQQRSSSNDNNINNSYSTSGPYSNPEVGGRDWRQEQEEEDARLARLLASQGDSFNELDEHDVPPYPIIADTPRQRGVTPPSSGSTSYQTDNPSYGHDTAAHQSDAFVPNNTATRNDHFHMAPSTRNEYSERPPLTVPSTRNEYNDRAHSTRNEDTDRPSSSARNDFVARAASHEPIVPPYPRGSDQSGNWVVSNGSPHTDEVDAFELVVPSFGSDRKQPVVPSRPMGDSRAHGSQDRLYPDPARPGVGPFHPEAPASSPRQPRQLPQVTTDFNIPRQMNNYGVVAHSGYVDNSSRPSSQEFQPPPKGGESPQFTRQPIHPQTHQMPRTNSSGGIHPTAANSAGTRSGQAGSIANSPMSPTFRDPGLSRNGTVPPGRKRFDPNPLHPGPLQEPGMAGPISPHPRGGYMSPSATASRDPNPLDRGPLEGLTPTTTPKPPFMSAGGRGSTDGSAEDSLVSLLPGDAFLDVPVPLKKDKKKKGIIGKFFGGRSGTTTTTNNITGGKETASTKSPPPPASSKTAHLADVGADGMDVSGGRQRRLAGFPNPYVFNGERGSGGGGGTSETGRWNANQVDDTEGRSVARFHIPPPVPRPADTIGAPRGPLPYSVSVCKEVPTLPEATVGRKPQLALSRGSHTCSVCGLATQNPLTALDKKYHGDCFRCITCHERIDPSGSFAFIETNGDRQPLHRKCYSEIFGVKCVVCFQSIPAGPDGKVSFVKHPFFDTEQMCPRHARNMTRRCTGCHRFEPENEPFADLNDVGRRVCLACCRSVIVDSQDAQPLWGKVVEFFEHQLNMPIWKDFRDIPILVVGYNALNDQMTSTCNVHGGSSQIMTRGLCLTEHESGRRFRMDRLKFDDSSQMFVAIDAEERGFTFFQVPDASKVNPDASVTAILCLSGLPRDLCASVLAHEATHAWIKLHPRFDFERPIPPQVEEGCAQLIAHLFLNEGLDPPHPLDNNDGTGPSDEKLRQYFKFSIETDDHEIYGTGYRRAAMAYSNIGIEALMSHVVLYQDFPET